MRIWSLHPEVLDAKGLVALWREALLAQAVLRGRTTGYRHHPQLIRFRDCPSPLGAIADYLRVVHAEANVRGYRFDARRISRASAAAQIPVARGQLRFEWEHLLQKLERRDPERFDQLIATKRLHAHPLFIVVRGGVADWERSGRA